MTAGQTSPRRMSSLLAGSVALLLLAAIGSRSWLTAIYHLTRGSRLLEPIMAAARQDDPGLPVCGSQVTLPAEATATIQHAIEALSRAHQTNPRLSEPLLLSGRAYCLLQQPALAVEALQAFIDLRPENPVGYLELGFALESICLENLSRQDGDTSQLAPSCPEHQQIAQSWLSAGLSAQEFVARGEEAQRRDHPEEAIRWYRRALWLDRTAWAAWMGGAEAYLELAEERRGDEALEQAIRLQPDSRDFWYRAGMYHESRQDWASALDDYRQGLQAKTGQSGVSNLYFWIGLTQQTRLPDPDFDAALASYSAALEADAYTVDPWQKAATYNRRAQILASKELWEAATADYESVLALDPKHYGAHLGLAQALHRTGEVERAEATLRRAIELEPERPNAYFALAELYKARGELDQAIELYNKVLAISPENDWARQELQTLGVTPSAP